MGLWQAINEGQPIVSVRFDKCDIPLPLRPDGYIDLTSKFREGVDRLISLFPLNLEPAEKASKKKLRRKRVKPVKPNRPGAQDEKPDHPRPQGETSRTVNIVLSPFPVLLDEDIDHPPLDAGGDLFNFIGMLNKAQKLPTALQAAPFSELLKEKRLASLKALPVNGDFQLRIAPAPEPFLPIQRNRVSMSGPFGRADYHYGPRKLGNPPLLKMSVEIGIPSSITFAALDDSSRFIRFNLWKEKTTTHL
jgi:hypothetical protein